MTTCRPSSPRSVQVFVWRCVWHEPSGCRRVASVLPSLLAAPSRAVCVSAVQLPLPAGRALGLQRPACVTLPVARQERQDVPALSRGWLDLVLCPARGPVTRDAAAQA